MAKRGAKQKYTDPGRIERILNALESGATERIAAAYGGISQDTLTRWKQQHADFADRLIEAESKGAIRQLLNINRAAQGTIDPQTGLYTDPPDWRASSWLLERRFPEEYGKSVVDTRLSGKDGGPLTVNIGIRPDGPGFQ